MDGPQVPRSVAQGPPGPPSPDVRVTAPRDATTFEINRSVYPGGAEPGSGVFDSVQTGPAPDVSETLGVDLPENLGQITDTESPYQSFTLDPDQAGGVPTGAPASSAATGGVTDIDTRRFGESIRDAFTPGDDKGILSSLKQAFLPQQPSWKDLAKSRYPGVDPNTLSYSVRRVCLRKPQAWLPT